MEEAEHDWMTKSRHREEWRGFGEAHVKEATSTNIIS